jgi:hypothetical protein
VDLLNDAGAVPGIGLDQHPGVQPGVVAREAVDIDMVDAGGLLAADRDRTAAAAHPVVAQDDVP